MRRGTPGQSAVLAPNAVAALNQAASAIGHAVEVLDEAKVSGLLRDDTALLFERYSAVLNKARVHA